MAGQILGDRYQVERQLGKKAGRWTLLAIDLKTKDFVILKVLFLDESLQPNDLKLFKREIDTLKTLAHPAAPKYLGQFDIDLPKNGKALVLIQSHVKGKSLEQFLQEKRLFSEPAARRIGRDILALLSYIHNHQPPIVHRDIKPGNILLTPNPGEQGAQVYLVDFGSVKAFPSGGNTSLTIVGTEGYMPPEQIGGRAITASDIYSLGVTLTTAVTGLPPSQLPYHGMRIDFDPLLQRFAHISPAFAAWLQQMTSPVLEKRFNSAQAALEALKTLG